MASKCGKVVCFRIFLKWWSANQMTTMHAYSLLYFSPQLHPKSCDHVTLGLRDHHRRPRMSNDRLDSVDGVLVQYLPGLYFHGTNCTVSPSTESEYEKTVICVYLSGNPIVAASCHSNTRVAFTIHRLYLNMLGNSNNKNCRCNCTTICVLLLLINKGVILHSWVSVLYSSIVSLPNHHKIIKMSIFECFRQSSVTK